MKNINYIQNLIQTKQQLCIFIDYKDGIEIFKDAFDSNNISLRFIRIFQNFSKQNFINIYILKNDDTKEKDIKKLEKKIENLNSLENSLENIILKTKEYTNTYFLYIGNNSEISAYIKEKNGISISIKNNTNIQQNTDISLSKQNFEEILIETNNVYLY